MTQSAGWLAWTRKKTGLVLKFYNNDEHFYIFSDDKASASLFDYSGRVMRIEDGKWIKIGDAEKLAEQKAFVIDMGNHRYRAYNLSQLLDCAVDYIPVFV